MAKGGMETRNIDNSFKEFCYNDHKPLSNNNKVFNVKNLS